jgi:regulator of protease activity HflC (stomatin/prohibitin superfamily)
MSKFMKIAAVVALASFAVGCARVETGEIGLRIGFDKQVKKEELQPGSFNQEFIGDVLLFPVKEIALHVDKLMPQTLDKSTLAGLDFTVIYSINPSAAYELYTTKSHSLHGTDDKGNTFLMYNYLSTVANSAAYKSIAKYEALQTTNHRAEIEADIKNFMAEALHNEHLDTAIILSQVQVRNIQPAASIIESANAVITQQNALRAKQVEVQTAVAEAQRLKELAGNPQSIEYMHAKALQDIAEGVKTGKVHTIVVPYDFRGIISVPTKQ